MDLREAPDIKESFIAAYAKRINVSAAEQAKPEFKAKADKAAGREMYDRIYLNSDTKIQVKLNNVKTEHDLAYIAHIDHHCDYADCPPLPMNLCTAAWVALYNYFSPSAPASTAQRIMIYNNS